MSESLHSVFLRVRRTHFHTMYTLLTDKEVYPGQPSLLFSLYRKNGQSQKELAADLRIKAATITVMLNRMEKTGLVERKSDPQDQRVSRVFLTAKGKEAHDDVKKVESLMEAISFRHFSTEEMEIFRKLLLQIEDNLEKAKENNELLASNAASEDNIG